MFVRPSFDPILQQMLCEHVVDGTTIKASFFDGSGVLTYPWRSAVEALAGRERHTLRSESRSWQVTDKTLCAAMRLLSEFDLEIARSHSSDGRSDYVDHHLLAEVNDRHLRTYKKVSVDRLSACMSLAAELISNPSSSCVEYLFEASIILLERLPGSGLPFDGDSIVHVEADCAGLAWGIYEVPATWDVDDIKRALWRIE